MFSRVVSHGLEGRRLRATYKEADQLEYQDSLGQLLLATASTVPDGLLMFLPSYALMEKLTKRWQVGAPAWPQHRRQSLLATDGTAVPPLGPQQTMSKWQHC